MTKGHSYIDQNFAARVDWNLLKLFVEIVNAGGIGAAARRLNKQQPSISAAVKRLEDYAEAKLLIRGATGIEVTPAGRALLRICQEMFESARMAPHQIAQAVKQVEGLARIQMVSSVISPELDDAIASFHLRHPAVRIELRVSPWRDVLDSLEKGEVEVGIGYDSGVRSSLRYEPMFIETQQIYCSRSHPLYGHQAFKLNELHEEGFILTGGDEVDTITRLRQRYRLGSVVNGLAEDIHEALRLIKLGVGIGFLPKLAAEALKKKEQLWPLLSKEDEPSYTIFLIARAMPSRDTATQLILDEIIRCIRASVESYI